LGVGAGAIDDYASGADKIKNDTLSAWMIFLTPSLCNQFGGGMALHWVAA
jgi:hypothetical protein